MKRIALALLLVACGGQASEPATPATQAPAADPTPATEAHAHPHGAPAPAAKNAVDPTEAKLDEVARIHGEAGPWAVLGYRMSEYAMETLGLARGSFDVSIVHWSPKEVQYSCIADGAAAHSGASLGKLNLSMVEASADNVLTVYRDKKTGRAIALRPTASFKKRFADVPRGQARALGRDVLALPRAELFEEVGIAQAKAETH